MAYRLSNYKIHLVREGSLSVEEKNISSPSVVNDIAQKYLQYADREHLIVILLNTKNIAIGIHTVSIGDLTSAIVNPREVFKTAILANAASIILVHNHPSGNPMPSNDDLTVTRRIDAAGKLLDIELVDHIIIGRDCFHSLKEGGLF